MEDTSENKRKPEVLMIYYTPAERGGSRGKMRSLRGALPSAAVSSKSLQNVNIIARTIEAAASELLIRGVSNDKNVASLSSAAPCFRIGIEVSSFSPFVSGKGAIQNFMASTVDVVGVPLALSKPTPDTKAKMLPISWVCPMHFSKYENEELVRSMWCANETRGSSIAIAQRRNERRTFQLLHFLNSARVLNSHLVYIHV